METKEKTLLSWLKDAHAMEKAAIDILESQEGRMEHYPMLDEKVSEHLETSRRQAERVKGCIKRLGGDTSVIKQGIAKFMGNVGALTNAGAPDEAVKNGIANYTVEHFEIASYRALVAAAEEAGDDETRRVCEEILQEEEAMAEWLEQNLPQVTQEYLQRDNLQEAKR